MLASQIAARIGGRFLGDDKNLLRIEPLFNAAEGSLSVVLWPKDINLAKKSQADCLLIGLDYAADYADQISSSLIVADDFASTFVFLAGLFKKIPQEQTLASSARIHQTAQIGQASIGKNSVIGPYVVVEDGAVIGENCMLEAGTTIAGNVSLGNNVHIKAHSVIGSAAFVPFGQNPTKNLCSLGDVVIEDHVLIGALCTIDRGLIGSTTIKKNSLLDNQVHVGHDVYIGENVVVAGQSGFAGFVRIENDVTIGGQVGVKPHVHIEQGARISGKSLVHCDIKHHEIWSGNPSVPHSIYLRAYGRLKRDLGEHRKF